MSARVGSITVAAGDTPSREVIAARIDLGCAEYHDTCCSWVMWCADESLFDGYQPCDCGGPEMAKAYAEGVL